MFACAALAGSLLSVTPSPALALVIKPTFDSSVTSRSNAAAIESAFDSAAAILDKAFPNPVTVNITVSWGSVAGHALSSGDIGGSTDNLSGPYSYTSMVSYLTAASKANPTDATLAGAVAHLSKTDPTKKNSFEIPYAEAQALGMLPRTLAITDGYIGFSSGAQFDFNPVDGVSAGYYDFQGLAGHEIEEVLGRVTGLGAGTTRWATPFDLYRYAGVGVPNFSYSTAAYFSIDGGHTNLGDFNISGGGDRSDWYAASGLTDLQTAYLTTGRAYALSASDLTGLDALGWGVWNPSGLQLSPGPSTLSGVSAAMSATPEPSSWAMLVLGFGFVGALGRRERLVRSRHAPN
jgi:hypothetical protein